MNTRDQPRVQDGLQILIELYNEAYVDTLVNPSDMTSIRCKILAMQIREVLDERYGASKDSAKRPRRS